MMWVKETYLIELTVRKETSLKNWTKGTLQYLEKIS